MIALEPGDSRTVEIELPRRAFTSGDTSVRDWVVAAGEYRVQVCADANTVLAEASVTLGGDRIAGELTLDTPVGTWFNHPDVGERAKDTLGFTGVPVPEEQMAMVVSMTMRQFVRISGLDVPEEALEELMAATRTN
jgi:beta-glucosidase